MSSAADMLCSAHAWVHTQCTCCGSLGGRTLAVRRALCKVARMHRAVAQQQLALAVRPAARVDCPHVDRSLGQRHDPGAMALTALTAGQRSGGALLRAGALLRLLPWLRRHRRELV